MPERSPCAAGGCLVDPRASGAVLRAELVGVLFQSGNLIDHLTVDGNLGLGKALIGRRRHVTAGGDLLDHLGIAHRRHTFPRDLSGGETARAAVRGRVRERATLVAGRRADGRARLDDGADDLALLRSHADEGVGVVVVTHSDAIARIADTVIHLRDGKVVA